MIGYKPAKGSVFASKDELWLCAMYAEDAKSNICDVAATL